jgi:hypothetical protein
VFTVERRTEENEDLPASPAAAPLSPASAGEDAGRAFRYTVDDAGLAQVVLDVPGKSVN